MKRSSFYRNGGSLLMRLFAMRKALAVLALLAGFIFAATAPAWAVGGVTGEVTGQIVDSGGHGISGARIALVSPSATLTQTTGAGGRFQFLGVPVDTYTISVQAQGYQPFSQPGITVTGGNTTVLGTLPLTRQALRTIARTTARSQSSAFQPSQTIPQFTVSGNILQSAQGKQANSNETEALLAAPGFQTSNTGGLILQGSTTDAIRYQFDGVPFTDPGFNTNSNNLFFNGISSVQIVPGAGDPSQGDGGAGVVNLLVKRGTYPATGLVDLETLTRPFGHQLNLQYGIATRSNNFSDFISFFGTRANRQYGAWGVTAFDEGIPYGLSYQTENDFINNAVVRFGKGEGQSLQFLYTEHTADFYQNLTAIPYLYDNQDPGELAQASEFTGLPPALTAQVESLDPGQTGNPHQTVPDLVSPQSSQLIKFEYDNQFNPSTYLALRYYHSDVYSFTSGSASQYFVPTAFPLYAQTAGGSRTGGIFELTKEADPHNTLTLSGQYEFDRPNFSTITPLQGVETLGPNAAMFLRPPNPNAPVSPTNPCPVDQGPLGTTGPNGLPEFPGACALQQYFYTKGGTPTIPPLDLGSLYTPLYYGIGLRDQIQVNQRLRLDLGVRYDRFNSGYGSTLYYVDEDVQPVPGDPSIYYPKDYPFIQQPHFLEPRAGFSYRLGNNDSIAFSYGRSINQSGGGEYASPEEYGAFVPFAGIPVGPGTPVYNDWIPVNYLGNPLATPSTCRPTVPYPAGASPTSQPSYNGTVAGPHPTLQLGQPCADLADLLRNAEDAYYPEVAAAQPAVFDTFDFNYAHLFRSGSALKIAPFYRQGYKVQAITAPLVFDPTTGTYVPGSLTTQSLGKNTTTGIDVDFTLPDRPYGLTGFLDATYVNEFTNTPPAGDNPYGQDFEPIILPQSLSAGNVYRAGFVSPFSANLGLSYKTRSGFRINPVLHFVDGYPYNVGLLTPYVSPLYGAINVPNTNLTDQYGPPGAVQFVDPANPGTVAKPIIAATRGTAETPSGGGLLSPPQVFGDLTLEYSPPGTRATFGVQVLDLFNNEYFNTPTINGNYLPVTTGVAGPLTGQSIVGASFPNKYPVVATATYPYAPYTIGAPVSGLNDFPTTFRLYFQYAL